jgi:hypothetical protein
MISMLCKFIIILLFFIEIKTLDNPEKEFEDFLKSTDDQIRVAAKSYQTFEKFYRREGFKLYKFVNNTKLISSGNFSKEFEKNLRNFSQICTEYLKTKPFAMNDTEMIYPKPICVKANEAIAEYENVMLTFFLTYCGLQRNITLLKEGFSALNSNLQSNMTELQNNLTSLLNTHFEHLTNASNNFELAAHQAAYNTSNHLISLKVRTLQFCGIKEGKERERKSTSFSAKAITMKTTGILRTSTSRIATYSWKDDADFRPVDLN